MRNLISPRAALAFCFAFGPMAKADPAPIENGKSPDGLFDVVVECDKDSPNYAGRYERSGGDETVPALLIRRVETGKTIRRIKWNGDPNSDEQPLREHTKIYWNPRSRVVVIGTDERFYSRIEIYSYNGKTGAFDQVEKPSYQALTGFPVPQQKDLRPRGHSWVDGWNGEGNLIYYLILSPAGGYEGKDTMHYQALLSFKDGKVKVVSHKMFPRDR